MPERYSKAYHVVDLLSDVLGRGKSSRLYEQLVKKDRLFNSLNAYVTSSIDPGLLVISGKLNEGVSIEKGDRAIEDLLENIKQHEISEEELQKVKNQAEASLIFSEVELLNRAMNLAFAALQGIPEYVNQEPELIQQVTGHELKVMAERILVAENCSTLFYRANKTQAND
jgi:predicted Zn-dependent peptidase